MENIGGVATLFQSQKLNCIFVLDLLVEVLLLYTIIQAFFGCSSFSFLIILKFYVSCILAQEMRKP